MLAVFSCSSHPSVSMSKHTHPTTKKSNTLADVRHFLYLQRQLQRPRSSPASALHVHHGQRQTTFSSRFFVPLFRYGFSSDNCQPPPWKPPALPFLFNAMGKFEIISQTIVGCEFTLSSLPLFLVHHSLTVSVFQRTSFQPALSFSSGTHPSRQLPSTSSRTVRAPLHAPHHSAGKDN